MSRLEGSTLKERANAFWRIYRYGGMDEGEGPLLLSYVVWPDGIPDVVMKILMPGRS